MRDIEKKGQYLTGLEREIYDYLFKKENKDGASCSRMAKPKWQGGIRNGGIGHNHLRDVLTRMVNKGVIFTKKETRKNKDGTSYMKYLLYKINLEDHVGVPGFITNREEIYSKFLKKYYRMLYIGFLRYAGLCELCAYWGDVLRERNCGLFAYLYQTMPQLLTNDNAKMRDIYNEIYNKERESEYPIPLNNLSDENINSMRNIVKGWLGDLPPFSVFIEDLTAEICVPQISLSPTPNCSDCEHKKRCFQEGKDWVRGFLKDFVEGLPKSKLKDFWRGMLSQKPKIDFILLYKYFSQRYPLKKYHNRFIIFDYYKTHNTLPYLYTKVIPLAIARLIEGEIIPRVKELNKICEQYGKKLKRLG